MVLKSFFFFKFLSLYKYNSTLLYTHNNVLLTVILRATSLQVFYDSIV